MLDSPGANDKYNYLDTCLDKIIDKEQDSKEEYDILVTEKDVGESCRNTSEKIKRRLKLKADRMTPEFKLSSEENSFRGKERRSS